MCGIAGLINFNDGYIDNIKQSLYHRGPDAQSHYKYNNLSLIHTRLSIQDIEHGDQPFVIGDYVIIFNGEIYNHLELRNRIRTHTFRTRSDTETLLALYIEYGIDALDMCDGMFAFSILDKKINRILLSRDRMGKKPLYIYRKGRQVFFASELNALLHSLPDLSIDKEAISGYLRAGFFFRENTPYNDVEEITPGTVYEMDLEKLDVKISSYFDLGKYYGSILDITEREALDKIDRILHLSVRDRLLSSDLDVGIFLSGGIDSSLITAIASQYVDRLKTFTVQFDDSYYDESSLAKKTANQFSTDHHELNISMDLKNDSEKILSAYGEPFMDSSAIPSHYISREAKKNVTIVLNGDGADELFGGYRRYVPIAHGWNRYASYFAWAKSILPLPSRKETNYSYLYRLLSMSSKRELDFYLSATTDIFEDVYNFGSNRSIGDMNDFIVSINERHISPLSRMLLLDSQIILPSDLLKKMDIATMSNSLEARSPFLSKYMVEFCPKLPDNMKINGLTTKYILRQLCGRYSLNKVASQPKRGFEVPLVKWVDGALKNNIFDALGDNCYSRSYISTQFISNLLSSKINISTEKRAKILWDMYSLEVWHNNYIKSSPVNNSYPYISIDNSANKT